MQPKLAMLGHLSFFFAIKELQTSSFQLCKAFTAYFLGGTLDFLNALCPYLPYGLK